MTKYFPALVLALLATPAFAEPTAPATSIVRTADLDLASKSGQRALDRRISVAVAEVCGTASDADLAGQNEVRRCRVATRQHVAGTRDSALASASARPIEIAAR
jgi:UrcA family protein